MSNQQNDFFVEMQTGALETKMLLGEITKEQYDQACKRVVNNLEDCDTALVSVLPNFVKSA